LIPDQLVKDFSFLWGQMFLEGLGVDELLGLIDHILGAPIMLARGRQSALWTSLALNHVSLQVHGSILQLVKPLFF